MMNVWKALFGIYILLTCHQLHIVQSFKFSVVHKNNFQTFSKLYQSTPQQSSVSNTEKLPLPFMDVQSLGIIGGWYEQSGNYVLKPKGVSKPIGVIHFLGGAFVGAAPHLTYKYLLESLSEAGYIIVATPYRLNMDYTAICDSVLSKFEGVAVELAKELGPVPVIGLGHSCGALLHTLITSLFPDTPRALNILISYNNNPASKAIPAFRELIIPISEQIMSSTNEDATRFRTTLSNLRNNIDSLIDNYAKSELSPKFVNNELVPLLKQSVEITDQVVPLLQTIANGQHEFSPTPIDTKEVCRRMYRARKTLLIKFDNDQIDESLEIEKILREANTIMRMKRPMIEMQVELKILQGTHITPLTQNIILDPPPNILNSSLFNTLDILKPLRQDVRKNFLQTVNEVRTEILNFLSANIGQSTTVSVPTRTTVSTDNNYDTNE